MNDYTIIINPEKLLAIIEKPYLKITIPNLFVGDNIKIGFLIKEGNKERTQFYEGIIISQKNTGINKMITIRKVFRGIGIERTFLIHSPKLVSIERIKSSKIRRSKLYYLRTLHGKAIRLKQKFN
jgi:large subunit ribosomal protein L19|uniref:Large ribosomal subunit protein bL19c n=1 Tax=Vaucheria litorea TaxID=109269 RepID=B7T202_VAULI|nr:ribosomal protein L19 [Vaucheria litorea]ACF70968.1 ribosomal protein L19 [Vaucheria litorea]